VALRMQKRAESGMRAQEEEDDGKVKSWTCARHVIFKGAGAAPCFRRWARRVSGTSAHTHAPSGGTGTHSHMPQSLRNTDLEHLCAVMMERSHPSRQPK
jgi:hypothetical protein